MDSLPLSISVIIPTHNRRESLIRLLTALSKQSFPSDLIEVIIVADGVSDDTVEHVKKFRAPFDLSVISLNGSGPGVARNEGARLAKNNLLLFLDDDIEPSAGLLMAHASAHTNLQTVTVGYLPLKPPDNNTFFFRILRSWWEEKYHHMRQPGYRFSYQDLLSGNFAISATLFNDLGGFDSTFRCREDYELGARLIKIDAKFTFVPEAWGFHNDERYNLDLTFKRKFAEGFADVSFCKKHPDIFPTHPLWLYLTSQVRLSQRMLWLTFNAPLVLVMIRIFGRIFIQVASYFHMRNRYRRVQHFLFDLYYIQGLSKAMGSMQSVDAFLQKAVINPDERFLKVDLALGLAEVEKIVDEQRPRAIALYYQEIVFAKLNPQAGFEPWKGEHVKAELFKNFSLHFMKAVATDCTAINPLYSKQGSSEAGKFEHSK